MKRGYLLPDGCKDLIDVLKPKVQHTAAEMIVTSEMTVTELAAALAQKPFRIIADLMELGVFANVNQQLDFDTISRVVRKYGFIAKRAA